MIGMLIKVVQSEVHETQSHRKRQLISRISTLQQRAKNAVSDSPGLVDFAIGIVNSVFNLPDGQEIFLDEFE